MRFSYITCRINKPPAKRSTRWHDLTREIKDCNCRKVTFLVWTNNSRVCFNSTSFSFGSRSSIANVSNSMPRNAKISVGSTVLSSATGTPHNLHISRKVCNVNWHFGLSASAPKKKSSNWSKISVLAVFCSVNQCNAVENFSKSEQLIEAPNGRHLLK